MWKLLTTLLILTAAISASILADRDDRSAEFVFVNRGDVTTLDMAKVSWQQDIRVARALYEGLVRMDVFSWDYRATPGVAERWEKSADGLTYTFHMRADARWSNGDPVVAQDFDAAWLRALIPDTASDYSGFIEHIAGARELAAWRSERLAEFAKGPGGLDAANELWSQTIDRWRATVGVRLIDERTIEVRLARPAPYFLDLVAFPVMAPVHRGLLARYQRLDPRTGMMQAEQGWTKPPESITNGQYMLTRWRFKRDMLLEANPHYWNRASLGVDSILMRTVEDPNAQVLAFRTGSVRWVTDVVARYVPEMLEQKRAYYTENLAQYQSMVAQGLDPIEIDRRLPRDSRSTIHVLPAFGTYFLNFNCMPQLRDGRLNPFADPRVRRAFTMAVNRSEIAASVRRLGEDPAPTLVPPGSIAGYTSPKGLDYDPHAARTLLAQAGYPDGRGMPTIDILFTRDGGHDVIAEAVAKQWEANLGVSVSLTQKELKAFREDLKGQNFMVSRGSWFGDYGDPTTFLEINRSGDGNNDRAYANPAFDALLDQAGDERDPARRLEILSRAEALMLDDAPLLTLFQYATVYIFDPHDFTGLSAHPRADQDLGLLDIYADGKGPDRPLALPPTPRVPLDGAHPLSVIPNAPLQEAGGT